MFVTDLFAVGEFCERDLDKCRTNPCGTGATCHNINDSFLCNCSVQARGGELCGETSVPAGILDGIWGDRLEEIIGIGVGGASCDSFSFFL